MSKQDQQALVAGLVLLSGWLVAGVVVAVVTVRGH